MKVASQWGTVVLENIILTVPLICPWSSIIRNSSDSTPQTLTRSAPTGITSMSTKNQNEENQKFCFILRDTIVIYMCQQFFFENLAYHT